MRRPGASPRSNRRSPVPALATVDPLLREVGADLRIDAFSDASLALGTQSMTGALPNRMTVHSNSRTLQRRGSRTQVIHSSRAADKEDAIRGL